MMIPLLQLIHKEVKHTLPMERFYTHAGITRQGFIQALERQQQADHMWLEIEKLVLDYRKKKDRRAGSRTLHCHLNIKDKYGIGVSKFEQLLSAKGYCLAPLRTKVVTTKSSLQSWNYSNLLNSLKVKDINQVVVGDIMYVFLKGQRFFLLCLTDIYSARIVGHCISRNMRAVEAMEAAQMWIKLRKPENLVGCIHHTDGGGQYFSDLYLGMLKDLKAKVSRAVTCLENGYAEQRNGLIKHHLIPLIEMVGTDVPRQQMKKVIKIYNHERKQKELNWLSPVEYEKYTENLDPKPQMQLHDFKQNGFGF